MVNYPRCSAIWLDNIYSYAIEQHNPQYISCDVKTPFEELQDLCTQTNYVAYVVPAMERKDDILVMKTQSNAITDEIISDGIGGNVIDISNWVDDPISAGIANQSTKSFNNPPDANGNSVGGTSYFEDRTSIAEYGPIQDYEFLDSVDNQPDADLLTKSDVQNNSRQLPGFSVDIFGSVLIDPLSNILVDIEGSKIVGYNQIMSITQTIDRNASEEFMATVDLNRPGLIFLQKINEIRQGLQRAQNQLSINNYRQAGLAGLGASSPGAFSKF